jgi:hypothetical protein
VHIHTHVIAHTCINTHTRLHTYTHRPGASIQTALNSSASVIGAAEANARADLERADALLRQAMDHVLASAQVWNLIGVCACVFVCVYGYVSAACVRIWRGQMHC